MGYIYHSPDYPAPILARNYDKLEEEPPPPSPTGEVLVDRA